MKNQIKTQTNYVNKTPKSVLTLLIVFLLPAISFTQPYGQGYSGRNVCRLDIMERFIPDLTDEQIETIDGYRVEFLKKTKDSRNLIAVNEAKLNTLLTADEVDEKEIDKLIDEIYKEKAIIKKEQAKYIQKIRLELNDSQRTIFDMHFVKFFHHSTGPMHKRGRGYGYGYRHQYRYGNFKD